MKRSLVIGLVCLAVTGLSLAGFGYWCLGTTAGARWLLGAAGSLSGTVITAAELEGSLLAGLDLKDLRAAWKGGEIRAGELRLGMKRFRPWSGVLAIEELTVNRLVLQLDEETGEAQPVDSVAQSAEMSLAVLPEWLEVTIDRLKITGFVYRSSSTPADETVIADLIAGQYRLADHQLVSQDFAYHSPYVELDGAFAWELTRPHLAMTAQVHLPETCVDPALFKGIAVPTEFPGHLELDGDWNGYAGPIRFGTIDETGKSVWLSARATGSWRGIHLADLKGQYLGGALAGDLDLAWIDAYRMHGQLSVQDLDPSALIEETTGKATFDISGELLVPYDDQPLQASIAALLHEGQFRGHTLQGRAAGSWTGGTLNDLDVDLTGDGARLLAKGVPAQRVEVDLEVADLSAFHTELAGQAVAKGWMSWSDDSLAGEIAGHGDNLGWRETRVRRIEFQGRHRTGEERIALALFGEDWSHGTYHLKRVTGELSGDLADHQLQLAAEGSVGRFKVWASGSYRSNKWIGRLEQLTGDDTPWGTWSMPQPTALRWEQGVVSIDKLRLTGDQGTHLELDAQGWGSPDRADISLQWEGLDLAWLQPYTHLAILAGNSQGQMHYAMSAGRPLSITGEIAAHGRAEDDLFALEYATLKLDFAWDESGLRLASTAKSAAGEGLQARLTAPGPLTWDWPLLDLKADLQWQQLELARLSRVLEKSEVATVSALSGRSDGQLRYEISGGNPSSLSGHVSAKGLVREDHFELEYETLALNFDWDQKGLNLSGMLDSTTGEVIRARMTATGPLRWQWPIQGLVADLQLQKVNLSRFNRFLKDSHIDGQVEGDLSFAFSGKRLSRVGAHLSAEGRMLQGESELGPRSLVADLNWEAEHFRCTAKVAGLRGGHATLQMTSTQAPSLSWPQSGQIDLEVKGLNLAALEPLLPHDVEVAGLFEGKAGGNWRDGGTIELSGKMHLLESHIGWSSEEGQIRLPLQDAEAEWNWSHDTLTGSFAMNLAEHGDLRGSWQLPLPARMPAAFDPAGRVQANLAGRMQAIGLLSSIGPWLVQDVQGETWVDLDLQGTWADPDPQGEIIFRGGSAYLPSAGVQLDNVNVHVKLAGDRLRLEQLEVHSGPGVVNGHGELVFDRFALTEYHLNLIGRNFQVVNFPELQVLCNPDLDLSGTPARLSVQGSVLIPLMAIRESKGTPGIQVSRDVVIVKKDRQRQDLSFATDILVAVELGDDVTYRSGGVDTHLKGGAILSMGPTGELLAHGEIQLFAGTYRAHGVNLKIRQGVLSYKGGVITNPDLRIFAAREVGTVLAGVQITGNAQAPVVTLYSQPTMPERDILGYMLMGRAIKTEDQETDMLVMGTTSLLPGGGTGLADLGITEIDIQGLFDGTGGVRLRRPITDKWEVESTLGTESGVDLYYIIEFE